LYVQCNYGVRFDGPYDVDLMIEGLCKEVEKRMTNVAVKGIKVTLKVKQRKAGAPPPPKYLGHGSCHNLSKSNEVKSGVATRDWNCFYEVVMNLYSELNVDKADVRGMGVVISNLVADAAEKQVMATPKQSVAKWFNNNATKSDAVSSKRKVAFLLPKSNAEFLDSDENSTSSDILWVGSSDKRTRTDQRDDTDDIVLPALSQIHMSQVNELPSPLRRKVVLKMDSEKGNSTLHVSEPEESYHGSRDVRRRQTNVKRMLRLAAVKSGATELRNELGQAISLTQLDCLPLDLQLEIANSDSHGLGPLSPPSKTNRKEDPLLPSKSFCATESPQASSSPIINRISVDSKDNNAAHSVVATAPPQSAHGTVDFVRDNLRPLTQFLDAHTPVDVAAMQQVTDFLCLCVSQNRLSDAVQLLRSIQSRTDLWGTQGFDPLFDAVNHQVQLSFRASLDKDWLRKL
jgi:impB/mucB/samB family C-terminal domain